MKRIFLFIVTNIAVLVVISIIFSVFGIGDYLANQGTELDLGALLVFSAIVGFTGSIISLLMSKWSAKRMTGAQVITQPRGEAEQWLVSTVARHARTAGIGMPEVAVYQAPEMNAFATGAFKNSALVAVSTGLMQQMSRDEVDAVLASMIVMWFSRWREFRADAGGAKLAGRDRMIGALQRLGGGAQRDLPDQLAAFGINGVRAGGFRRLFMSHPPIAERIAALQNPR